MRTDQEIVDQTNDLARLLLSRLVGTGYEAPEGHKFYEAEDPRSQKAWAAAVEVMEFMTQTDANDALANLPAEPQEYAFDVHLFATIRVNAASEAEGRQLLKDYVDGTEANLGSWPDGEPILCNVSLNDKRSVESADNPPDVLAALKAIMPYAQSRVEDMNEAPDEHSAKAAAAFEDAQRIIAEMEGNTNG